jgi:hypothetical protein
MKWHIIPTRSLLSRVSLKARSSIFFSSLFFASRNAPASFAAYHIKSIPITEQSQERRGDSIQATRAYKDRKLENKYYRNLEE